MPAKVAFGEYGGFFQPLAGQPGYRGRRESGTRTRELIQSGPEIPDDRPCRYSNGSTADTSFDLRPHAGRIRDENRPR